MEQDRNSFPEHRSQYHLIEVSIAHYTFESLIQKTAVECLSFYREVVAEQNPSPHRAHLTMKETAQTRQKGTGAVP